MKFLRIALTVLALGLLVVFLVSVDWQEVGSSLRKTDLGWLIVVAALVLVNLTTKALRLRLIAGAYGARIPLRSSWRISTVGIGLGMLTPARVGEAVKVLGLRDHGLSTSAAFGAVIIERLFDVAALGGFAVTFAFQISTALGVGSAVILGVAALLLIVSRRGSLDRFFPERIRTAIHGWHPTAMNARLVSSVLGLTVFVWLVESTVLFAVLHGLGVDVVLWKLPGLTAATTLAGILSLLPVGAGTFDLSLAAGLTFLGAARPDAVAAVFDLRIMSTLFPIGLAFLVGATSFRRRLRAAPL